MIRKVLAGGVLFIVCASAQADYQCSTSPRDDVVISPQSVQVVGKNGNLIITPEGQVQFNGQDYTLSSAERQQAVAYQQALRTDIPWIDNGARARLEKGRASLDQIIVSQVGEDSKMRQRLTQLDGQLKTEMNRIIEHRKDGLTFHYQAIDQVRSEGQQKVNQAMGGILQDSINEMGAKAVLKGDGNPLQNILGNLGGLQTAIQNEWKSQQTDFQQFGREVCARVTNLEQQRQDLIHHLKG